VRYVVCANWQDDRNETVLPQTLEMEREQKELVPPIEEGHEQEESVAQTP
jgi:hypothetical protein